MQKPIHVCIVSCYPPSRGPLSEYTFHLAQQFAWDNRISRITVLADKIDGDRESSQAKIAVVRCWSLNDARIPVNVLWNIHRTKPDIVYFNLLFRHFSRGRIVNLIGLCTPSLARLLRRPVVVTLHSISEGVDLREVGYGYSFANRFGSWLATRLLLSSDLVTLTHQHLVDVLKAKYGAKNVLHVPHGVFYQPKGYTPFKGKRFLLFGKIGQYKNPALAVEAFKEVSEKFKDAELVIAGPPHPLQPGILKSAIEGCEMVNNIEIRGYVPEDELETLFRHCTAVILPYTTTTWSSGVFNLACAFGRPVIASDLPDFRALQREAGVILFPRGDSHGLATAMVSILGDTELQRRLGEANARWASKYDVSDAANKLIEVFEELTDPSHNLLKD